MGWELDRSAISRGTITLAATPSVADLATSITYASVPHAMPTNAFGRLSNAKANGGIGAKWTFHRGAEAGSKGSFSLAGVLDYEDFQLEAGSTEEEKQKAVRWNARFEFDHAFASGASFTHVTFWQPRMDSLGDYVVEMSKSISTRLTSSLSPAIQHEYLHDEIPPPGAKPNDQKFSVVLRVSL